MIVKLEYPNHYILLVIGQLLFDLGLDDVHLGLCRFNSSFAHTPIHKLSLIPI